MRKSEASGFTVIELLIVVVIIAILAAITIPKAASIRTKAHIATVTAELKNLATLQEIYMGEQQEYAPNIATLGMTVSPAVTISVDQATDTGWAATATHTGLDGRFCSIYYGNSSPTNVDPAASPGLVACN